MVSPIFQPYFSASPLPTTPELRSERKSCFEPCRKRRLKTSRALGPSMANWAKKFFRSL